MADGPRGHCCGECRAIARRAADPHFRHDRRRGGGQGTWRCHAARDRQDVPCRRVLRLGHDRTERRPDRLAGCERDPEVAAHARGRCARVPARHQGDPCGRVVARSMLRRGADRARLAAAGSDAPCVPTFGAPADLLVDQRGGDLDHAAGRAHRDRQRAREDAAAPGGARRAGYRADLRCLDAAARRPRGTRGGRRVRAAVVGALRCRAVPAPGDRTRRTRRPAAAGGRARAPRGGVRQRNLDHGATVLRGAARASACGRWPRSTTLG